MNQFIIKNTLIDGTECRANINTDTIKSLSVSFRPKNLLQDVDILWECGNEEHFVISNEQMIELMEVVCNR